MGTLVGKVVLITGASRGLGRQLALDFARAGAAKLALVARSADALAQVRAGLRQIAPETESIGIVADLARGEDVDRVAATTLAAFGGQLDVLVNNASALGPTP